jgi:hypothetical protein
MSSPAVDASVSAHYGRKDLMDLVTAGLAKAGKADGALTPDDLAVFDQFHTRGKEATVDMARRAAIRAADRVLDVGGGIGGAARVLAHEHGCRVTVVDHRGVLPRGRDADRARRARRPRHVPSRQRTGAAVPRRELRRRVDAAQHDEHRRQGRAHA